MPESASAEWFGDNRPIGPEFRKSYKRRVREGFMDRYLAGDHILDIGYRGGDPRTVPITEKAIGVELDYPGYDGKRLPFNDGSQDAVLASHVLEHIPDYRSVLAEWYRVLRVGGHLVLFVPHKYLFEKRPDIPSRWAGDHRRFYTPTSLLREIEDSLPLNGFRIRHLVENDDSFHYDDTADMPPVGCFEIELVVEKIVCPAYSDALVYPLAVRRMMSSVDQLIIEAVAEALKGGPATELFGTIIGGTRYFTPWQRLREHFEFAEAPELDRGRVTEAELKRVVRPLLELVDIDVATYVDVCRDLGGHSDPAGHWRSHGYFEGRGTRDLGRVTRDLTGAAVRHKAGGGQIMTCHGTVLFMDAASCELRHGQPLTSPTNIQLARRDGAAYVFHVPKGGEGSALYVPVVNDAPQPAESHPSTVFEFIDVGRDGFGLASGGLFLCAEDTGRVTLSRHHLGRWETFQMVDMVPAKQQSIDEAPERR